MNHQGGRGREIGLLLYVLVMSTGSTWAEPYRVFGIKYQSHPWYVNWCGNWYGNWCGNWYGNWCGNWYGNWCGNWYGNWYGKLTVCSDASHLTLAMFVHQQTLTTHTSSYSSVAHQLSITYYVMSHTACGG